MKKYNVGIIGMGTVSATHVSALQGIPNVLIKAVCDIRPDVEIPLGATLYNDYHTMLQKEHLDSLHICLPHYLHLPVVRDCAKYKIPILCEKPIAMNKTEVDEMIAISEQSPYPLAVCLQNRWNATFVRLQELLASGDYGKITGIKGVALWSRAESYYTSAPWRGQMQYAGGGCLINQAVHTLDQMLTLGGDVESLSAVQTNLTGYAIDVEDSAMINITFKNGAKGFCIASNANVRNASIEIEVACENRIFTIKDFTLYESSLEDEFSKKEIVKDVILAGSKSYYGASHVLLINDFYKYLDNPALGKFVNIANGGRVISLLDLVRKSSAEKRSVSWEEEYGC